MKYCIAFDLDGTLVEAVPFSAYENDDLPVLAGARQNRPVAHYARTLLARGIPIAIITGRHQRVEETTRKVLYRLGLPRVPLYQRTSEPFDLNSAVREKTAALWESGAILMVGDRDDLDGAAARKAGIPFLHVNHIPGAV